MGVVYMAEQEQPVRRKVALKIIKPGMDTAQVIARFEAERQALALMDHTNIARVFDAGTTDSGRPYFVMELVHGVPITKYCDDNQLTPRERLELFVPVCQAIQHAHQKGIIHRDIKPSNVLVTMYDDKPVPKVIDFGVAKAIEQRLTERTLFTQFGAMVGTFEYMSPEQAEMNAFGVDTRSDIYSLGVLLYELLTGTTPLEKQRLREAALGEMLRLIKEEEPPRPSMRLSRLGRPAEDRGGAEDGAGAAVEAGARRAGLDRDEVPGEGPDAAVRDGQRAGPGRRALPARRAGGGVPAVGRLPAAEVRAQAPDAARRRGGLPRPAGGRRHLQHVAGGAGPAGRGAGHGRGGPGRGGRAAGPSGAGRGHGGPEGGRRPAGRGRGGAAIAAAVAVRLGHATGRGGVGIGQSRQDARPPGWSTARRRARPTCGASNGITCDGWGRSCRRPRSGRWGRRSQPRRDTPRPGLLARVADIAEMDKGSNSS